MVHIVDDGSDDGVTPEKLAAIKYDKAEVFLNKDNRGVVYRANQHYRMFDTKYVLVFCSDDKLAPNFLEKTVAFLEKNPKYGAVSTDMYYYMDSFEGEPFSTFHFDEKKMGLPEMLSECHCLGSSLMRNKALKEIDLGGFQRYQDWDRWVSMLEKGWKIGLIPEPLFMYRLHDKSLSHSSSVEIETETFHKIIMKHKELYQKYNVEVMEALFAKFQESGFYNKALSRQYIKIEKQNLELLEKEKKQDLPLSRKMVRRVKSVLKTRK